MAQLRHDHFSPTRYMERIVIAGDTSSADGPNWPFIPLREWRQRFGEPMDVLKMRINTGFDSENGITVKNAAKETVNPQGVQNIRKTTKKSAFRSGGNFIGALFNV